MFNKLAYTAFLDELEKNAGPIVDLISKFAPRVGKFIGEAVAGSNVASKALTAADIASGAKVEIGAGWKWFQNPIKKVVGDVFAHTEKTYDIVAGQGSIGGAFKAIGNNWTHGVRESAPSTGLFFNKTPVIDGSNIYKRTPLGMITHPAANLGVGMGALTAATTPGSVTTKLREGAEQAAWWGPGRTLAAAKATVYDIPKAIADMIKPKKLPNVDFSPNT